MKAYFTASITGKKEYIENYLLIIKELENNHVAVIAEHIISSEKSRLVVEKKSEILAFQRKLKKWITESDFTVAEVSFPSISVGYEISLAVSLGKPVLILYSTEYPPTLLAHHAEEAVITESYDEKTLPSVIADFVNYVKGASDHRFTFFISSKIANFLEEISKKRNIPKSVYLRQLIEKEIKN